MARGKLATCRREHPEVELATWYTLPELLKEPLAIFPSRRRDGTVVVLLITQDRDGHPIIVAMLPDQGSQQNIILSVYGKEAGMPWVAEQLRHAEADNLLVLQG